MGRRSADSGQGWLHSAFQVLAQAARDLESMLWPTSALSERRPRLPARAAPCIAPDRKSGDAQRDVERNAPLIQKQVKDWLQAQRPGAAVAGARIFCEPGWTPLTAHLADLVVADCGPQLADLARQVVAGAGARIEMALQQTGKSRQQCALAQSLTEVLTIENSVTRLDQSAMVSERLAGFLGQVRDDVQGRTLEHKGRGTDSAGLPGAHVVANILFACGLRSVVQQLRQQAQAQPPTPASRWVEGRPGLARVNEATLYDWLESMCLEVGHAHGKFDGYDVFAAAALNKAHQAVKQFCTGIRYPRGVVVLHTPTPSPKLLRPGPAGGTAPRHPQVVSSPEQRDGDRTPSSRSESRASPLTSDDFVTPMSGRAQLPDGADD